MRPAAIRGACTAAATPGGRRRAVTATTAKGSGAATDRTAYIIELAAARPPWQESLDPAHTTCTVYTEKIYIPYRGGPLGAYIEHTESA